MQFTFLFWAPAAQASQVIQAPPQAFPSKNRTWKPGPTANDLQDMTSQNHLYPLIKNFSLQILKFAHTTEQPLHTFVAVRSHEKVKQFKNVEF